MKHTPGPWQWWTSNSFLRLSSQATGKDGDVIDSFSMSDGATSLSVKVADMHLIEAAPDLLEVLKSIIELQTRGYVVLGDKYTDMARAAISKALGEE